MKLYNRTKVPDNLLIPLLTVAGRKVGARTSKVVVIVNAALRRGVSGLALECYKTRRPGRWIETDGGAFIIRIPNPREWWRRNALALAEDIFEVAMHEWTHVRDYQRVAAGEALAFDRARRGGRRPPHRLRHEEKRACAAVHDAKVAGIPMETQEAILNLAIWYEEVRP